MSVWPSERPEYECGLSGPEAEYSLVRGQGSSKKNGKPPVRHGTRCRVSLAVCSAQGTRAANGAASHITSIHFTSKVWCALNREGHRSFQVSGDPHLLYNYTIHCKSSKHLHLLFCLTFEHFYNYFIHLYRAHNFSPLKKYPSKIGVHVFSSDDLIFLH